MSKSPLFTTSSSSLTFRPSTWDDHSDEEITSLILSDRPISSEKNIWAFWHSGWEGMKPWRQRNIISWVRRHDSSWEVRVLDLVPGSPRHVQQFLRSEMLPEALNADKMIGHSRNAPQHISDMIRLPLLYEYGGVWIDVGMFLLQDLEDICWHALCDPEDPHEFCAILMPISYTQSFPLSSFLASLAGNVFLMHWHTIFMELWKDKTSCNGMSSNPLLVKFPQWPINDVIQEALGQDVTIESYNDYLAHMLACIRLVSIADLDADFLGPDYWNRHCRFFTVDQIYPLHNIFSGALGFSERRQYELYRLPRKAPVSNEDAEQQEALRFVEGTLTSSILKKLSNGPCTTATLASLWDHDKDADIEPGTWGEYFQWATVHLVPSQMPIPCEFGEHGVQRITRAFKMGILEPKDPDIAEVIEVK